MGARLTWTSSGERKIDTREEGPTNGSTASSTPSTRPSAGASTPLDTTGISRSGSRKNPSDASEAAQNGRATRRWPSSVRPAATTAGPTMNGQPSLAIGSFCSTLHPRRLDPGHHRAQALADFLDLMIGVAPAHGQEARAVGLVLEHPLARELPRLDLTQDLLHLPLRLVAHHARAAGVVAVLRGVGDGVAHVGEAALIEEVHDQLHLVHALEVRDLRLVAGFDERLEGRLDQVRDAAAERRLLAEEIRLRLFLEGRLDHARARAADAPAVRHRDVARLGGVGDGRHLQPVLLGLRPGLGALVEADDHVLARVLEVQRVGVALAAIPDDRDLLALEEAEVGVLVVIDLRRHACSF